MDSIELAPIRVTDNKIRKRSSVFCFAVLCFLFFVAAVAVTFTRYPTSPGILVSQNGDVTVDYSNSSEGYISVKHATNTRKTKLRVIYGGNTDTYDLKCDDNYYVFPLKYGSGTYTVNIYGQVSGTRYAQVFGTDFYANISDPNSCYLYPNQRVWWTEGDALTALTEEICAGLDSDLAKVQAIYKWVTSNIKYDYIKALNIETGYLPDISSILETKTGICYDYASLLCAMLRNEGIYAQLATGTLNQNTYHAWVRVYIDGTWKMLDPTFLTKYKSDNYKLENTY